MLLILIGQVIRFFLCKVVFWSGNKLKLIVPPKKEINPPNSKGKAVQYADRTERIGVRNLVSREATHTGIVYTREANYDLKKKA